MTTVEEVIEVEATPIEDDSVEPKKKLGKKIKVAIGVGVGIALTAIAGLAISALGSSGSYEKVEEDDSIEEEIDDVEIDDDDEDDDE